MRLVDEFRDPELALEWSRSLHKLATRPWNIMEVCGGQTHSILRFGIDQLLPKHVTLLHGPCCPVCVTPIELIDQAIALARRPDVIFTSFGDMLRVPGSATDLLTVKAQGGDVRILYSPLEALRLARENPAKEVIFFAVGFETTAPAHAMAVSQAKAMGLKNFSILVSHVLVPPAMEAILSSPDHRVNGFLGAGHVCTIVGEDEYLPIAERYKVPIVITGFEPIDLLQGIYLCVKQLEEGRHEVENEYARAARTKGNPVAQRVVAEVFEVCDRKWRGIGEIPASGLRLRPAFQEFDASLKFKVSEMHVDEPENCISGLVLQGLKKPSECPAFGKECHPEHPLGATMVSTEGACAAYYRYRGFSEALPSESLVEIQ
jgi:hydrogenase expression/formation protein HypD